MSSNQNDLGPIGEQTSEHAGEKSPEQTSSGTDTPVQSFDQKAISDIEGGDQSAGSPRNFSNFKASTTLFY